RRREPVLLADGSVDTKARVELACGVLQTLPLPSGSFVLAAPPGVDPRSRGSEPRALPLSYGASNGQGGRLRSCGLVRPRHALYQIELHPDGAHGRIRTRIFSPVTFILLRRQEGYVCIWQS